MTIQITLKKDQTVIIYNVSVRKLRALRSLHGKDNLKLLFSYKLQDLAW